MSHQTTLSFTTRGRSTLDITARVAEVVRAAGVTVGLCHVFVQHTSCALMITENADPDVRRDLETIFGRLAPDGDPAYRHDLEGDDDMAAHARSLLTGVSLSVPFAGGRLLLGTWQGIALCEPRRHGGARQLLLTVCAV